LVSLVVFIWEYSNLNSKN